MYKIKLYSTMIGTLALFIGLSTLAIIMLSDYLGWGLYMGITLAVLFNLVQWILAPKIIESMYKVKPLPKDEAPYIHEVVEKLSKKMGIKKPEVMIADIDVPNAFAYGGVFGKKKVAVTRGLLNTLDKDEVEAVVGHEMGHVAHRDVSIMMFLSVLPSVFYLISRMALYQLYFTGGGRDRDSSPLIFMAIGILSLVFYFILNLILLGFSRLREYYADYEAATRIEQGAEKLMHALAKIAAYTEQKYKKKETITSSSFKALLIADPDTYRVDTRALYYREDKLVEDILNRRLTLMDRLFELFSTHPNMVKRLRRLKQLAETSAA